MSVPPPFRITAADISRSSLDRGDLGLWAVLVCGCYHLFETEHAARHAYRLLLRDISVR